MIHLAPILALIVSGASSPGDTKDSVNAAGAKVVRETDASAALEQTPPPPPPKGIQIEHEDGSTILTLSNAQISLSNRVQFRFTDEIPANNVRLPGTTSEGQSKPSFRIRRAKTALEGWVWRKELTFEVQLSWAGPEAGSPTQTPIEDALITWDASKRGAFMLTVGQFKVPLGRQEMTSSGRLQFADRSLLNGEFTRGRDTGIQVHGRVANDKVGYFAGVFNGNSASRITNDNTKLQYNARLSIEPLGKVAYSESAFEAWDKPLVALAAQFENNDLSGATNLTDLNTTILSADLVFKHKGFSLFAEYFNRRRKPEAADGAGSATSGPSAQSPGAFNSNGFNIQAGFFLKRDRVEIAGRFAGYDPSNKTPSNSHRETGGVINVFVVKHSFKVVTDFRALRDDLSRETNRELRVQTQLTF